MDISTLLCSDGYFLYNKTLARVLGPGEAIMIGLFCSKYNYYKQRDELLNVDGKEYFFCVRSWIENETGLTVDKQRAIIQSLQTYKILDVKKIGMPAKNYYSLDFEALCKCFENPTTSGPEILPQEVEKSDLSNNKTVIPKGITPNNKNEEDIVEVPSTSQISTESRKEKSKTLEDLRKKYITNEAKQDVVAEVVDYLNSVSGKNYKATTPETQRLISGRLKEGYTVEHMKQVIDNRWELWKNTEMEQYIRPNTLFRPSNFENYVNSLGIKVTRKRGGRGCSDTLAQTGTQTKKTPNEPSSTLAGRKF